MTSMLPIRDASQRGNPHRRLIHAIVTLAGGQDVAAPVTVSHAPWASATFQGTRHLIELRLSGPDARARATRLADALPRAEFTLPGHIVADIAVDRLAPVPDPGAWQLSLSALTIEDW